MVDDLPRIEDGDKSGPSELLLAILTAVLTTATSGLAGWVVDSAREAHESRRNPKKEQEGDGVTMTPAAFDNLRRRTKRLRISEKQTTTE